MHWRICPPERIFPQQRSFAPGIRHAFFRLVAASLVTLPPPPLLLLLLLLLILDPPILLKGVGGCGASL